MASELPETGLSSIPIAFSIFRSSMKEQFDNPMSSFLKLFARDFIAIYLDILSVFANGQHYFGKKINFREILSSLNIWRIPVSGLY